MQSGLERLRYTTATDEVTGILTRARIQAIAKFRAHEVIIQQASGMNGRIGG
jgi:hypothetical protein